TISSRLVTRRRVFHALILTWIALLFVCYYVGEYSRLDFGAVGLLSSGFLLSTYILYAGRHVATKSDIKALDYVTVLGFCGCSHKHCRDRHPNISNEIDYSNRTS